MVNEQNTEEVYDEFTTEIEDINKLINLEIIGYIYIGRDNCPVCLYFNRFLKKEFEINENLLVYKFDTNYWRENESFQEVLDKYGVTNIPTLIKVNEDKSYKKFEVNDESDEEVQLKLNEFLYN